MEIKVILAEDIEYMRRTLAESLRAQPEIVVLGEASNGLELVNLCRRTPPDVVVTDIRMPLMDGVEAAKIIRREMPSVRLLILTAFDDEQYLRELFGLGIDGYLLKTDSTLPLAKAVHSVYSGAGAVGAGVTQKLGSLLNPSPGPEVLTEYELRVTRMIANGRYNKEIASELGITYGRARNLISGIYRKFGVTGRLELLSKLGNAG